MTDSEISKALALAIGWRDDNVHVIRGAVFVDVWSGPVVHNYRKLDYRDWNVIGPIAEKYNAFPKYGGPLMGWECWIEDGYAHADTPQKAIALAVIGAKK